MRYVLAVVAGVAMLVASACGGDSGEETPSATWAPPSATVVTGTATPVITSTAVGVPRTGTPEATTTPGVDGGTGIAGLVTIGPTCPVERPESPCPDRPYEATIQVLDADGTVVAEVQSGTDGRFAVTLAPGIYTLHMVTGTTPPSAEDQTVTVRAGTVTEVAIQFDSGIR